MPRSTLGSRGRACSRQNGNFAAGVVFVNTRLRIFLVVMLVALGWAGFTRHVWEDYYITYRASKNLATGHGLVFTEGQRVHSFTSPLGVLLPALASGLTGNSSDVAALWIFRLMAAAALAGAVVLLTEVFKGGGAGGRWVAWLPVALVLTDAKTVDYTINGMETPFLLLFMAWTMRLLFASGPLAWGKLGLAWAGLMWTRPDAFVYIGALAGGAWLIRPAGASRGRVAVDFLKAGGVTTAIYLPWLLWAWSYYGTPVPHTITAKGLFLPPFSLGLLGEWIIAFPGKVWSDPSLLAGTFMPAYAKSTGWPLGANWAAAALAAVAALLWVVPRLRWEARVASLGALAGQFYLHSFVGFPIPWYMPAITFLSLTALGLGLAQLAAGRARGLALGLAFVLVAATGTLAGAAAWQLRCQQRIVEDGNRRQIGEWLRSQSASPKETVFLEPLGYIGFFSGLKMLDYPGLSSPEVVAARQRATSQSYPFCWSEIIMDLQPDWLVLRQHEREFIQNRDAEVLEHYYERARVFDVRAEVAAVKFLPGRAYLENDAYYEVYRRKAGLPAGVSLRRIRQTDLTKRDSWGQPAYDSGRNLLAHAPSTVEFPVGKGSSGLSGGFGLLEGAYTNPANATDGAGFIITHVTETGERTVLLERLLRPQSEAGDRGPQRFRVKLPAGGGGRIELHINVGAYGSNAFDWTYWAELTVETPQDWR